MRRPRLSSPVLVLAASIMLAATVHAQPLRDRIPLPDGFQPEGISIRNGNNFFVGSIPTGAIYRANARTGEGAIFVKAREGRSAVGLKVRFRKLYVAGGDTGQAYVYDARSGAEVAAFQLTQAPTFVNDVVVTKEAAWFTDSINPVLYKVPLRGKGNPDKQANVETVALDGVRYQEGFNVNGITATRDGDELIIVQSNTGSLFNVDADTGKAERVDLEGARVRSGDGILLDGTTLFVVQNALNEIAVVRLDHDLESGEIVRRLRDDDLDVPTTVAQKDGSLYVVNARFSTPPTLETKYWVTVIPAP